VHEDGLTFTPHEDGTANLYGKVYSVTDPDHVLIVDIEVNMKRSWAEWSSLLVSGSDDQYRTYKFDGETAETADLHLDWDYYEIDPDNSFLIGEGALDGTVLSLSQAPAALQYGFQVGEAANNTNSNYGLSSWMYYDGPLVIDGESLGNIEGTGDVAADLDCGPNFGSQCAYEYMRTWTATDDCGNSTVVTQVVVVNDNTPPVITSCPADYEVQCFDDVLPCDVSDVIASDNCGDVTITCIQGAMVGDGCPGTVTNTYIATDDCGNTAVCTQTITVNDTEAPMLVGTGPDLVVECEADIPSTDLVSAEDNCDPSVLLELDESQLFDLDNECEVSDPVSILNNADLWSLILFSLPTDADLSANWLVHEDGLTFIDNGDGTASLVGKVYNDEAPNLIFQVDIQLMDKRNWVEWSSLPVNGNPGQFRTYKDDTGIAEAGNLFVDWDYYEIDPNNSYLFGLDGLAGTSLALEQAPSALQFGFQVGEAANNSNGNFGFSSWMYYEGEFVVNGVSYGTINGTGDVAGDLECGPNFGSATGYDLIRTWTATDDCGNTATHTQVITVLDSTPPSMINPGDITVTTTDPNGALYPLAFGEEDNCDPNPFLYITHSDDFLYPVDEYTEVTAICTDNSGNSIACTFTVFVGLEDIPDECAGDINGDQIVDINDFIDLNSMFGSTCEDCPEDLNGDGVVAVEDFLIFNTNFGNDCTQGIQGPGVSIGLNGALGDAIDRQASGAIHPELMKIVNELRSTISFDVVPNPNDGRNFSLFLNGEFDLDRNVDIQILDMTGRQVYRINSEQLNSKMSINTESQLSRGMYLVSMTLDGDVITKRMTVE